MDDRNYDYTSFPGDVPSVHQREDKVEADEKGQLWRQYIIAGIGRVDKVIQSLLCKILNSNLNDRAWLQASLPVRFGGLGVRKISDVSLPAFLSSVYGTEELTRKILGPTLVNSDVPVNIGLATTGYATGWGSPIHDIFANVTVSPLDHVVTSDQEAWIGSLLAIGAIFGPFLAGIVASMIGRKWGLIVSGVPMLIGWILIFITLNVYMIYAARIFWGLSIGMLFTISPIYCAEIATDDSRGALGSFLQLFSSSGFLIVYSTGPFVSYDVTAYIGFTFVAIFCVGMFFMPESPMYHLTKNREEAAIECLAKIRGRSHEAVRNEIKKIQLDVTIAMERSGTIGDIFRGNNLKALYISCALLFFMQFSGIDAVLFYCSSTFEAAGASLDPSIATIIIGAVLVVSTGITPFVVDRVGRRFLLLFSTAGSAISLGLFSMYCILAENKFPVVDHLGFLPLLSLVLYIITFSVGIGSLPLAVMSELLPIEVKTVAASMATTFLWISMFIVTRFFNPVVEAVGMGITFFMFASVEISAFFFILFLVPETKGKSFQEIQDILSGKSSRSCETVTVMELPPLIDEN